MRPLLSVAGGSDCGGPRAGGLRARGEPACRGAGFPAAEQFECRVHGWIARGQRLADARILEIGRCAVDVFEWLIRLDTAALDGSPGGSQVTRSRQLEGTALREWNHRLHRPL